MHPSQDIALYLYSQVREGIAPYYIPVKPYPPIPWSDSAIESLTVKEIRHWLQYATDKATLTWEGKDLALVLAELPQDATLRSLTELEKREPTTWEKSTGYATTLGNTIRFYYSKSFDTIGKKWFKDLERATEITEARSGRDVARAKRHFSQGYNEEERAQYWVEKHAKWHAEGQQARLAAKLVKDNPYATATMKIWWPDGEKHWLAGYNANA